MAFRSAFTELMQRNLYKWFFESYETFQPVYPQIFQVENMTGAFEQMTVGVGLGDLSERKEGDTIVADNILEGPTALIKARTFSSSFSMTSEAVKDADPSKLDDVMRRTAQGWGQRVISTKEKFAAKFFLYGGLTAGHDVFNNSIGGVTPIVDASGDFIYTGKPFFAASGNNHVSADGSTYYNQLGALSLTSTNLQTAYTLMTATNNRDERGGIVNIMPDTLLIPPQLHFTAKTLLESELITGSANNDKNSVQNLVQPIEWQYLTDTDAWYLGRRKAGLVFYERQAPVIDFYQDETNKKYYATIDTRFGAGVYNWRYWLASNISTS